MRKPSCVASFSYVDAVSTASASCKALCQNESLQVLLQQALRPPKRSKVASKCLQWLLSSCLEATWLTHSSIDFVKAKTPAVRKPGTSAMSIYGHSFSRRETSYLFFLPAFALDFTLLFSSFTSSFFTSSFSFLAGSSCLHWQFLSLQLPCFMKA